MKARNHNEWFRTVGLGGRKSCPCCDTKLEAGEQIWSWGEYVRGKWQTVKHFCKSCFQAEVADKLRDHQAECDCNITLVAKGCRLPEWLTLKLDCDCDSLPEFDMDGSHFDGVCKKCAERIRKDEQESDAYDKLASGWVG